MVENLYKRLIHGLPAPTLDPHITFRSIYTSDGSTSEGGLVRMDGTGRPTTSLVSQVHRFRHRGYDEKVFPAGKSPTMVGTDRRVGSLNPYRTD